MIDGLQQELIHLSFIHHDEIDDAMRDEGDVAKMGTKYDRFVVLFVVEIHSFHPLLQRLVSVV